MKKWIKRNIKEIDSMLHLTWIRVGCDKPHNHDEIVQFMCEDVYETADHKNWHSGDVAIAFRRWIESQSKNQP